MNDEIESLKLLDSIETHDVNEAASRQDTLLNHSKNKASGLESSLSSTPGTKKHGREDLPLTTTYLYLSNISFEGF